MKRVALGIALVWLAACGQHATADAGAERPPPRASSDGGARPPARAPDAAAAPPRPAPDAAAAQAPPLPPPPEGPTGVDPVLHVRGLPAPAVLDAAGFEPVQVPWAALEALLVQTDAVSQGTRQSFTAISERPWGARPLEPFVFRKEAEPLAQPGYWHPIPRLSILTVPHDPLGPGGPNVAFYALAEGGVRFIRAFPDHGLTCAGGSTLVEGLSIQSAGTEVRRLYGCPGLGEEATIDVMRLDGTRLVATVVHGSFLVHRD